MSVVTVTFNPCIDKTFSVDRIAPDRKLIGEGVHDYAGGGGVNVARVVSRLGGQVNALWSQGGMIGDRLAALLDAEKLRHLPVRISGETRENIMVTDRSSEEQYRFGLPGPTLTEAEQSTWIDILKEHCTDARYVVISGSLPGETPLDWFTAVLKAMPSSAKLIVDTKKEALQKALDVGVYLVKPNVHELEEFVGKDLADEKEVERATKELIHNGGTEAMLVSLGRGGALLATRDSIYRYTAPAVHIQSKVGAGDSMVGGLVHALNRGESLQEATKLAVAAGTAAVMTDGTELCRPSDVERLLAHVYVPE